MFPLPHAVRRYNRIKFADKLQNNLFEKYSVITPIYFNRISHTGAVEYKNSGQKWIER